MVNQGIPGWSLPDTSEVPASQWATVATDVLNVREAPSVDAAIVDTFADGEVVQVTGEPESGFVPVAYGGGRAWMAKEYLSYDGSTPTMTDNPVPVQGVAAASIAEVPAGIETDETPALAPEEIETHEAPPAAEVVADPVGPAERWIDIDRSSSTVRLYDGTDSIASFRGRIGRDPSPDSFYSTATGTFHVYSMNKGLAPTPFADDTWLTDWVGFDPDRKNGIHSPVRDANGVEREWQNPSTLGCVRLNAEAAVAVFDFAEIGMRVEVHD